jgi:hypothetical protein
MGRVCSTHGNERNSYKILVRKPEEKRSVVGSCEYSNEPWGYIKRTKNFLTSGKKTSQGLCPQTCSYLTS